MNRIVRRVQRSIFLKLMLMFAGVSLAAVLLIFFFFDYFLPSPDRERDFRLKNRSHYAELLIHEIGEPPDLTTAARLAEGNQLDISIEGPGVRYRSAPAMPTLAELHERTIRGFDFRNAWTGFVWGSIYVALERGGYQYVFVFPYDPVLRARPGLGGALMAILLLMLLATYLFVQKLLRPLKRLHEGVQEVSAGNLSYRVPAEQSDEFGDLARSFNRMSARIREMINAKERLLLDVSHELRSPLTRISVALEVEGAGEIIRRNLREMESMIAELLDSARLDSSNWSLRLERTDLTALLREVAARHDGETPGVRLLPIPGEVFVQADPSRIRSVFQNVIENAIKYSPKDRNPVEISLVPRPSGGVEVTVRDFGIGISEAEQTLVFEPFYRVDKSRCKEKGGYGLGLSLARRIMLAHGGDLRLESTLNEGTRVTAVFTSVDTSPGDKPEAPR
jgi:signal transduction histidine kinase